MVKETSVLRCSCFRSSGPPRFLWISWKPAPKNNERFLADLQDKRDDRRRQWDSLYENVRNVHNCDKAYREVVHKEEAKKQELDQL